METTDTTAPPREVPASTLLAMLLDGIERDFRDARAQAIRAEAELRGIDLSTARFDPARRVWVLSPE
jgi:hypothetical protein